MKLRIDTLGLLFVGALALGGCQGNKGGAPATEQKGAPAAASQPAGQPASQPAAVPTSTKAQGALQKGSTPEGRDQVDPDGVMRRGKALTAAAAITVTDAVASADKLAGQSVKLTGKVDKVCEAMGCWFVVKGDKPEDRVKIVSKNHDIFVPTSAIGRLATVEGQLSIGKPAEGDDCAEHKDEKAHQAREISVEAAAVELLASNS